MLWRDSQQIGSQLEQVFNQILTERMQGLPLLNLQLKVQALDFVSINQDWLGILITPWFMNLLLLPGGDDEARLAAHWSTLTPGCKFTRSFPYGNFEFTVASELDLAEYAVCSLFSPMFQFAQQADAVAAGEAAMRQLLAEPQLTMQKVASPKRLSRRDLLRGALVGKA